MANPARIIAVDQFHVAVKSYNPGLDPNLLAQLPQCRLFQLLA
jgi:hypothetical protein